MKIRQFTAFRCASLAFSQAFALAISLQLAGFTPACTSTAMAAELTEVSSDFQSIEDALANLEGSSRGSCQVDSSGADESPESKARELLCTDPVQAVCMETEVVKKIDEKQISESILGRAEARLNRKNILTEVRDELIKSSKADRGKALLAPRTRNLSALKTYRVILEEGFKEMETRLRIANIDLEELETMTQFVSQAVARAVSRTYEAANELQKNGSKLNLPKLSLQSDGNVTFSRFLSQLDGLPIEVYDDVLRFCGPEGLERNAFYSPEHNKVIVCPGYFKNFLEEGNLLEWNRLLAHEFGHGAMEALHPRLSGDLKECFLEHYADRVPSLSEFVDETRDTTLPTLKMRKWQLKRETPDEDRRLIRSYRRTIARRKDDLRLAEKQLKSIREHGKTEPRGFVDDMDEINADYVSTLVLSTLLESLPVEKRAAVAIAQYRGYCPSKRPDEKTHPGWVGADYEVDAHLPDLFRIELPFKHPGVRKALGCAPLPMTAKPWCDIKAN